MSSIEREVEPLYSIKEALKAPEFVEKIDLGQQVADMTKALRKKTKTDPGHTEELFIKRDQLPGGKPVSSFKVILHSDNTESRSPEDIIPILSREPEEEICVLKVTPEKNTLLVAGSKTPLKNPEEISVLKEKWKSEKVRLSRLKLLLPMGREIVTLLLGRTPGGRLGEAKNNLEQKMFDSIKNENGIIEFSGPADRQSVEKVYGKITSPVALGDQRGSVKHVPPAIGGLHSHN